MRDVGAKTEAGEGWSRQVQELRHLSPPHQLAALFDLQ